MIAKANISRHLLVKALNTSHEGIVISSPHGAVTISIGGVQRMSEKEASKVRTHRAGKLEIACCQTQRMQLRKYPRLMGCSLVPAEGRQPDAGLESSPDYGFSGGSAPLGNSTHI